MIAGKGDILLYIRDRSKEESVSREIVLNVLKCESRLNPNALGDHGHSRGLAQIHNQYHPEISDEQAYDPYFAVDYLIEGIKEGRGHEWSCYRMLT